MKKLALLLIPLLLAACNLSPAAPVEPTTNPVPESVIATPGDLTQTYTDSILGFTVNFPADWVLDAEIPGDLIQLYSATALTPEPSKSEGLPPGSSKIEFIKIPPASPYSTIDGYIEFYQTTGHGPGTFEVINRFNLDGDIPAARMQFNGGVADNVAVTVFEINGVLVSAAGYGDTSRFDEIVSTLRRG